MRTGNVAVKAEGISLHPTLEAEIDDDHPRLDLRAEIAISVIDDGQDLTPLLDIIDALNAGG